MERFEGTIIYGQFDDQENEFTLRRIKNIITETSLNEKQLTDLYSYLKAHEDDVDGQIVSFYDQLLLKLSQDETKVLLADLESLLNNYQ